MSQEMEALEFIQTLVAQKICYAIKSVDTDLYDFGFSNEAETIDLGEDEHSFCGCSLHATCRFKIVWKRGEHRVDKYSEGTPCEKFHSEAKHLMGLSVKRVALSDKNDLWIDLSDCWIIFVTFEDGEESWRLFTPNSDSLHLVASNSCLEFT